MVSVNSSLAACLVWIASVKPEKPIVLIENLNDTGYVLFSSFFIMSLIMPTLYIDTVSYASY